MQLLISLFMAAFIGVFVGLGTAYLAVDSGAFLSVVRIGPWTAWASAGDPKADPYTRAMLARRGTIPMGPGEGVAFIARTDNQGRALVSRCDYHISGKAPPARLWTVTVTDNTGKFHSNPSERFALHSREVLRWSRNRLDLVLSEQARPGNWLPAPKESTLEVVLRIYDAPLATGSSLSDLPMPGIKRGVCR